MHLDLFLKYFPFAIFNGYAGYDIMSWKLFTWSCFSAVLASLYNKLERFLLIDNTNKYNSMMISVAPNNHYVFQISHF
jgi:hypothetical protein